MPYLTNSDFNSLLSQCIEGSNDALIQWAIYSARNKISLNQYLQAIEKLDSLIQINPFHAEALTLRAFMHSEGEGGKKDFQAAIAFYDKAIALGNTTAMSDRANMHQEGQGGEQNYPAAIALYERAIALGDANAMNCRAYMHRGGLGGEKNYPAAIELYEQAIALNNANAINSRAYMHQWGQGGEKNYSAAVELYEEAIALGNASAMNNRAYMHQWGLGGEKNYPAAVELYEEAIRLGNTCALSSLVYMRSHGLAFSVDADRLADLFRQCYDHNKDIAKIDFLSALKSLAEELYAIRANYHLAKLYLVGDALVSSNIDKAKEYIQAYPLEITELIYQDVLKLVSSSLKADRETLDILSSKMFDFFSEAQSAYLDFQLCLQNEKDVDAFNCYQANPAIEFYLTNQDYFRLANILAGAMNQKDLRAKKIEMLTEICDLFHKAYKLGDQDSYRLLMHYLSHKKAIAEKKEPVFEFPSDETCQRLLAEKAIEEYIDSEKQNRAQGLFSVENPSIPLAYQILKRLKGDQNLGDILNTNGIAAALKSCPKLDKLIRTFCSADISEEISNLVITSKK
jgi:TPR repeat protein